MSKMINVRSIRTNSFKTGLSLKPGLKLENWFKSYAHQKILTRFKSKLEFKLNLL
jgi:hypothetical protein